MKPHLQLVATASAGSLFAFAALAQNPTFPRTNHSDYSRQHATGQRLDRLNGAFKANEIIGMTVKNNQDEKLGKVEDIAVDVESGRILQVIVSTGGFIGIGDTLTAVPPGALHHDMAHRVLHLDADKEKLKAAPKFEMSKWGEYSDSDHLSQVYRYYGEEPNLRFIESGETPRDSRNSADYQRNADIQRKRTSDTAANTVSKRNPDGSWAKDRYANEHQYSIPASRLAHVQKASKLIGMPVKNLQDEKLGKVENLMLDLTSGRVVTVILSSGGFLGMGDELSAVPPSALRFTTDRDTLQLDASKEMLTSAPHFKANQWPDFSKPSYANGVYRAYKVDPYFNTDMATDSDYTVRKNRDRDGRAVADSDVTARNERDRDEARKIVKGDADNTARNVRDRDDRTLTPLDQGNSKADVDTTSQIRKEIVATKNLSTNARNVKIITLDGRVTLRGPVNSVEEKRLIGEIAARIASSGNVDNQIEVKAAD